MHELIEIDIPSNILYFKPSDPPHNCILFTEQKPSTITIFLDDFPTSVLVLQAPCYFTAYRYWFVGISTCIASDVSRIGRIRTIHSTTQDLPILPTYRPSVTIKFPFVALFTCLFALPNISVNSCIRVVQAGGAVDQRWKVAFFQFDAAIFL